MEVRARVQAHPDRAHLRPALLAALQPLPTEIIEHTSQPPSPWAGYQQCIAHPPDCTHLLIVQDDVLPCRNFAVAVEQIAAAKTSTPVCLFHGRLPNDSKPRPAAAIKMNRRYVTLSWRTFLPVVAVLWPIAKLEEFRLWAEDNPTLPGQREPRSDDAMGGRWKMRTRQTVLATVPSLVEHSLATPSVVGNDRKGSRVAAFLAADGLDYDWSMP